MKINEAAIEKDQEVVSTHYLVALHIDVFCRY